MEPKFQSSFIPKGPMAATASVSRSPVRSKSLLDTIASLIFTLTILSSVGIFAYNKYLNYSIDKMGAELESARGEVESEATRELIRLDARITSTKTLLANHVVISPLFDFLEDSTLGAVRFTDFEFANSDKGVELSMSGQARSYSALALQANVLSKSQYLKNQVFSNLDLDEKGNVIFSYKATIDPSLVAYRRIIESQNISTPQITPATTLAPTSSTTVSTSTKSTATSSSTTR